METFLKSLGKWAMVAVPAAVGAILSQVLLEKAAKDEIHDTLSIDFDDIDIDD